jgi:tRNA-dihydrouridine synthase
MVTVHGRTRCQFYKGQADWRAIARVKESVSIPVVANGDIGSPIEALAALAFSGADAVMVGRASYGAPWTPGDLARAAGGASGCAPGSGEAMADYVVSHYEDMLSLYGIEGGVRHARKHLGWYLDRHALCAHGDLRREVMTSVDPAQVIESLRSAFLHHGGAAAERAAA